jgi:hypothetical protein
VGVTMAETKVFQKCGKEKNRNEFHKNKYANDCKREEKRN